MRIVFKKTITICIAVIVVIISNAQDSENWTALSQTIDVSEFTGKKFKFSGAVKTSGSSEGLAMLWARVDKKDKKMGFFDNMQDRPVMLREWKEYSIEGTIDQDAQVLNVGVLCVNNGSCYYDELQLQVETSPGKWQTIPLANNNFETTEITNGIPAGWKTMRRSPKFSVSFASDGAYKGSSALVITGKSIEDGGSTSAYIKIGQFVKENYNKLEHQITMRDGIKLFTVVYVPKDASANKQYPILLTRTPYSAGPYGKDKYGVMIGPSETLIRDKYIFVHQDVRGRYMSEGLWTNMTPHIPNKKTNKDVDESSDTWDTFDWLVKNIQFNNGKAGMWGISYPGFYTTAGSINAHPALKAASPQAPIADFFFDDFHHNGAFTLAYFWNFPIFGTHSENPTSENWYTLFEKGTQDSYDFYRRLGTVKNAGEKYYKDNFLWQQIVNHPNYDTFWKKRSIVPHLTNIKPAVMVVGGWFDAEDLYGPLVTYKQIEKNNRNIYNTIVMGPFGHGDWSYEQGNHKHHHIYFGDSISTFYQRNIESKFFNHFLKGPATGNIGLPEAYMYNTGRKEWQQFEKWPPQQGQNRRLFFQKNEGLSFTAPKDNSYSQYISDPDKPVPYTMDIPGSFGITARNYMSEDQRFAGRRPDVLIFETDTLTEDVTLGGEIMVHLNVSTTGSDADWVVKLIDVYPGYEPNTPHTPKGITLSGYQQMVRSEVMRSRFRNSFEKPEPMVPNTVTPIKFQLQDVLHTFKKGHRIMVQVQSTWFPLIDLNPQKFVPNIYKADKKDFIKATHRVYHSGSNPSYIEVRVLDGK